MLSKKKVWVYIAIAGVIIAGIVIWQIMQSNQTCFNGSKIKNPDAYLLKFSYMNAKDSHTLNLAKGDTLQVKYHITKGKITVKVGRDGKQPIYRSSDIETGNFKLTISEDGEYVISIHAKKAKGSMEFKLKK